VYNTAIHYILEPAWRSIVLPLFCIDTVLWDAVWFLLAPPKVIEMRTDNQVSRRTRRSSAKRSRNHNTWISSLYFFSSSWLIMMVYAIVLNTDYKGKVPEHPFHQVQDRLSGAYCRIEALDNLVTLTPGTFMQYQGIQGKQLWSEWFPSLKTPECEVHGD
jgi:hypothetical protein